MRPLLEVEDVLIFNQYLNHHFMSTITITLPTIEDCQFTVEALEEFEAPENVLDEDQAEHVWEAMKQTIWAWCTVRIKASWKAFEGVTHLGCCNYASKEDFINNSGYYAQMKQDAFTDLMEQITSLA